MGSKVPPKKPIFIPLYFLLSCSRHFTHYLFCCLYCSFLFVTVQGRVAPIQSQVLLIMIPLCASAPLSLHRRPSEIRLWTGLLRDVINTVPKFDAAGCTSGQVRTGGSR